MIQRLEVLFSFLLCGRQILSFQLSRRLRRLYSQEDWCNSFEDQKPSDLISNLNSHDFFVSVCSCINTGPLFSAATFPPQILHPDSELEYFSLRLHFARLNKFSSSSPSLQGLNFSYHLNITYFLYSRLSLFFLNRYDAILKVTSPGLITMALTVLISSGSSSTIIFQDCICFSNPIRDCCHLAIE